MNQNGDGDITLSVPEELLEGIFLCLPAKTLGQAHVVCTRWHRIISGDGFALRHARTWTAKPPQFLIGSTSVSTLPLGLAFYVPLEEAAMGAGADGRPPAAECINNFLGVLDPVGKHPVRIISTCSGLVAFKRVLPDEQLKGRLCVGNPTTKSFVTLPRPRFDLYRAEYGLAFDLAVSSKAAFKLVAFETVLFPQKIAWHVFSSTRRCWRQFECSSHITGSANVAVVAAPPRHPPLRPFSRSVYCSGKLHWLTQDGRSIVVFDTTTHKDTVMDSALAGTMKLPKEHWCLGVCRGCCLSMVASIQGSVGGSGGGHDGLWTLQRQIAAPDVPKMIPVWHDGDKCVLVKDVETFQVPVRTMLHRIKDNSTVPQSQLWEELPLHREHWTHRYVDYFPFTNTMLLIKQ